MASDRPGDASTYTTGGGTIGPGAAVARRRDTLNTRERDEFPTFAELDARVVSIGSILAILADMFYFGAWFFAFLYLKALNNNNAWFPKGVQHPDGRFGFFVIALIVLSAIAYFLASRAPGALSPVWRIAGAVSLVLGTIATVLGLYHLWHLGFGMTDGGYAAVYVGLWGSVMVQFGLAMAWLLSMLLQSGPGGDAELRPASSAAFGRLLYFIAFAAIVAYLILYFAA